MSYTAIYSPIKSLERDTSGAVIEDIDAWHDYADRGGIFSTLYEKSVTRQEVIRDGYPGREFTVLYGFRTWERRDPDETLGYSTSTLGCHFNIERLGYRNGKFDEFFAELSRITEPFYFYQPAVNHGLDEHGENIIEDGPVKVAKVWGEDGKVEIEEYEIEARPLHTDNDPEPVPDGGVDRSADGSGRAFAEQTTRKEDAPENWEYVGGSEYDDAERYQNDCGLWLVVDGPKVVTRVGNFHVAVRGTEELIGEFDDDESALNAAFEWMEQNPNPWGDNRSLHTDSNDNTGALTDGGATSFGDERDDVSRSIRPEYETVKAAQARSGRWHLTGQYGCYNAPQVRSESERAVEISADKRTRDWCFYCEQQLEILRLRAEIDRLKLELEGSS